MSTRVSVNSFVYSVTHVTGEMMSGLKTIILLSGLSLEKIRNNWESVETAIYTWLTSRHLKKVTLEIYNHSHPIGLSVRAQKNWLEWFFNSATQQR
jgi:Bacterial HORMA domain 2